MVGNKIITGNANSGKIIFIQKRMSFLPVKT